MAPSSSVVGSKLESKIKHPPGKVATRVFGAVLAIGFVFAGSQLLRDLSHVHSSSVFPFILLGIALLIALAFEFVNGFHDTANAVATVIYTHSLEPHMAVLWSGCWNFLGVLLSSGAVAFGIISLLPVELILQVGVGAGFAMVFALLVAAIIWNLGTWFFGLPSSSSHTLIGSIIGVGLAEPAPLAEIGDERRRLVSGGQHRKIAAPVSDRRLRLRRRAAAPDEVRHPEQEALREPRGGRASALLDSQLRNVPADQTRNFRNDLYLVGEGLRLIHKTGQPAITARDADVLKNYKKHVDNATKFIPLWVKISVAIALGLGTMVGWKRIVVTVGEKIGKAHLTYAQGAAAEITAMLTIGAADMYGLPVSTTHVLSSGVAGTMAANRSGLQMSTVRNLLMAWVLTLPMSILLAGSLFWLFTRVF